MNREEEITSLVNRIARGYQPERIILFGSVARGEERTNSDIDLLIVKRTREKRPFRVKKVFETLRGMERHYPLDVLVYTPGEVEKRLRLGDYFVRRVLQEGQVLYE